jgi:asparagine synthase (glutamine-hydrolysing)
MPQWGLYRRARELGYKVLLSGIGGDEVFFGYPAWNKAAEDARAVPPGSFGRWIGFDGNPRMSQERQLLESIASESIEGLRNSIDYPLYALRDLAPKGPDSMSSMLFGSYLVNNGCLLADKLGMGCSVEVRVPLVDHVLVESVFSLPLARRFRPNETKPLLKSMLRGTITDVVLDAEKRGFSPPPRYLDRLVLDDLNEIRDGVISRSGLFDQGALERMCAQHGSLPRLRVQRLRRKVGLTDVSSILFRLLALERWYGVVKGDAAKSVVPRGSEAHRTPATYRATGGRHVTP